MLLIRELKFVSEERKLKPDFLSVCCCGARVQADGLARVSIMNLIIRTIYARPTRAGRNRHAVFLESDSVNPGKACRTRATVDPACGYIRNYMSMSAQMLRAHASAKTLSSALAVSDKPPLPGTTSMVF